MAEYISREDALLHSEIIRVYSKDYGNIDVVPVEYLADIPAADVQPVKRGRWIKANDKQGSYFLCSNCGTAEKTESDQDGTVWQHDEYCRKCGARMDGEQND